jgi:hypothetical protein
MVTWLLDDQCGRQRELTKCLHGCKSLHCPQACLRRTTYVWHAATEGYLEVPTSGLDMLAQGSRVPKRWQRLELCKRVDAWLACTQRKMLLYDAVYDVSVLLLQQLCGVVALLLASLAFGLTFALHCLARRLCVQDRGVLGGVSGGISA